MNTRVLVRIGCIVVLVAMAALALSCATAPVTGRRQLILMSDSEMTQLGMTSANELLRKEPIERGTPAARAVEAIGQRIATAAGTQGITWRFHTIRKDIPNAFALPGGEVFVYTGILKYARNDAQLAAVLGHEIAHVLARHGAERMSIAVASQAGAALAGAAVGDPQFAQAMGIAANYGVVLPYSRTQESEADRIGLILMAKAGYPPEAAIDLWRNMMQVPGQKPPPFLATHPSNEQRIADIKQYIPEARQYLP